MRWLIHLSGIKQKQGEGPYRLVFVAHNGPGPWPCHFCRKPVEMLSSTSRRDRFTVHHLNHNRKDFDADNLVPTHYGCHARFHFAQRRPTMRSPTGDDHWTRRHPEKVLRGEKHWRHGREIPTCPVCGRFRILADHHRRKTCGDTECVRVLRSEAAKRRWYTEPAQPTSEGG